MLLTATVSVGWTTDTQSEVVLELSEFALSVACPCSGAKIQEVLPVKNPSAQSVAVFVVAALCLPLLSCSSSDTPVTTAVPVATTVDTSVGDGPVEAEVGENGVSVSGKIGQIGVNATAPAGIADIGTTLTLSSGVGTNRKVFPAELVSTTPAQLTLGNGLQPKTPITLTFDLSGQPEIVRQISDSVRPIVAANSDDPASSDLLPAEWNAVSKSVTTTTTHLSSFQVLLTDVGQVLTDSFTQVWAASSGEPDELCSEKSELELAGTQYTLTPSKPGVVSACLRAAEEGIAVDFATKSAQYYEVNSQPPGQFVNQGPLKGTDQLAVLLRSSLGGGKSGLLTPKGNGTLVLPAGTTTGVVRLDVDAAALQLETILTGLDMYGIEGDELIDAFQTTKSAYDCLVTVYESLTDPSKANVGEFTTALGDLAQCGLAGATGAVGNSQGRILHKMSVVTSLFTTLPSQLMANIMGIAGEFNGDNHLEYTLKSTGPARATSTAPSPNNTGATLELITKITPNGFGFTRGPDHYEISDVHKNNGRFYVDVNYHWKLNRPEGSDLGYCRGHARITNSAGTEIARYDDTGFNICQGGGAFGTNTPIYDPGTYTVTVDVETERGAPLRIARDFTVDQ